MIVEIGHFALVLAMIVACVQMVAPLYAVRTGDVRYASVALPASIYQFLLVTISFLALTYAYVTSDFTVENVARNSHTAKPLIYRISGVWGNHEGSMLLWLLMLVGFGAAVGAFGSNLPLRLRATVLSVQSSIGLAFGLFILLTSNPFARLDPAPFDGQGLNPILQDPALAFHPPFLYAGYVGFSIAFSFAVAALIEGRTDAAWARWVRPWTLAAWMFLTLGIAMGSWWAYYELGWGGWWFWDPVENASFMPWLAGTALLHSALVMEKREALKVWTILLAILTFSLSLMGAFLVRSGVLSSVHAFAVDPERGVFILAIMVFFIGGSLSLFAMRMQQLREGGLFAPISREGSLVLNNVLLTTSCATVLIGTLYPLALEALTGAKISVGAPYFDLSFGLLMIPLLIALPFGPFLAWKRGDVVAAAERLMFCAIGAFLVAVLILALMWPGPWLAPFVFALGVWVMLGALQEIAFRIKLGRIAPAESWGRLKGLPRSVFGTALAHFGVGLMVIGIVGTSAYRMENVLVMKKGDTAKIAGYSLTFEGITKQRGPNYLEDVGRFVVTSGGEPVAELAPSKRTYQVPRQQTTEAGIHAAWMGDLYAVIGDAQSDGGYAIRLYFNPLVRFIWLGALVMFFGGLVSLSDRRLRVGAPRKARPACRDGAGRMMRAFKPITDLALTLCLAAIVLTGLAGGVAVAVQPDEILKDPKLEQRARKLSAELRCLVCQNQSIDDSNAPLARDLRLLVRERLKAGDTDEAIMDYIVARYGEFVLLRPPFGPHTLLLWLAPILVLGFGAFLARRAMRGRLPAASAHDQAQPASLINPEPLTDDERRRLQRLVRDDEV